MEPRLDVSQLAPVGYSGFLRVEKYLSSAPLDHTILELVKLRVSQINGCAFCVDMHAHDALDGGESLERLFAVSAWREAPYFSDAERAALALAEASTRLADASDPVTDEIWSAAADHFDQEQLAALTLAIAVINAWNRISVATRQVAGSHRRRESAAGAPPPT